MNQETILKTDLENVSLKYRNMPSYNNALEMLQLGNLDQLKTLYNEWVKTDVKINMSVFDPKTCEYGSIWLNALKRGNSLYSKYVKKQLSIIENNIGNITFFDETKKREIQTTNLLFCVLTYDRNKINLANAWLSLKSERQYELINNGENYRYKYLASEFSKFKARISKTFGKNSILRSWEDHKDGYPHVNILLLLENPVKVYYHKNGSWRMIGKKRIEKLWPWGYIDVIPVSKFGNELKQQSRTDKNSQSISHILKYMTKNYQKGGPEKSGYLMPILWGLRMRSFAISGKYFKEKLRKLETANGDLIEPICIIETKKSLIYTFNGVYPQICYYASLTNPNFKDRPPPDCIYRPEKKDCGSLRYKDPEDPNDHVCINLVKDFVKTYGNAAWELFKRNHSKYEMQTVLNIQ